jgi:hypothetical protein
VAIHIAYINPSTEVLALTGDRGSLIEGNLVGEAWGNPQVNVTRAIVLQAILHITLITIVVLGVLPELGKLGKERRTRFVDYHPHVNRSSRIPAEVCNLGGHVVPVEVASSLVNHIGRVAVVRDDVIVFDWKLVEEVESEGYSIVDFAIVRGGR